MAAGPQNSMEWCGKARGADSAPQCRMFDVWWLWVGVTFVHLNHLKSLGYGMTADTIAVINLKGGVGKTAISVNFAAYCGSVGIKTLLVDMDPQTNATFSCIGIEKWQEHAASRGTIANLLDLRGFSSANGQNKSVRDVIVKNVFPNVDLIPSHLDLFTIDLDLAGATAREKKLKRALEEVYPEYGVIICDCPPNLTIPTQNALAMSQYFVVPISPDFLSAVGVGLLLNRVEGLARDLEHEIEFLGIILSRVGRPAMHRDETVESLRERFGDQVFSGEIKERTKVKEASALHGSIFDMDDKAAIGEFTNIFDQILEKMGWIK